MKRPQPSRGSAASKSADHSNGAFTETIGTDTENLNGSNGSGAIGTIDPNDNSYFIQYHPEVAEKLSKHNSTYSVFCSSKFKINLSEKLFASLCLNII